MKRLGLALLFLATLSTVAYARGDIYSARAIKAMEQLINSVGQIGATTDSSGNLSVTTSALLPAGTAGAPAAQFSSDNDGTGTGIYRVAANVIGLATNGVGYLQLAADALQLKSTSTFAWSSGALNAASDLILSRENAAILQLGADVNGAATAQTIKSHDGITGTDVAGANLTVAAGRGTGAGTPGNLAFQASPDLSTGTTAQTLETRMSIIGKRQSITDNTATTIATVATGGAGGGSGGLVHIQARVVSGSEIHSLSALVSYSVADDTAGAGGEICAFALAGAAAQTAVTDAGSISLALATTTGTDLCNLRVTIDSTLNQAALVRFTYINTGGSAVVPQ